MSAHVSATRRGDGALRGRFLQVLPANVVPLDVLALAVRYTELSTHQTNHRLQSRCL